MITRGWDDDRIDEIGGVRVYRVSIPEPSWRRGTRFLNTHFFESRQILLWNLRVSQLVQRLVANQAIDVIQSPEYHAAGLLTALRHRRIPVVVRLSTPAYLCRQTSGVTVGGSRWDTLISERLEYYMARSAAAVTSPSQKLAEDVSRNWHLDVRAVRLVRTPVDDDCSVRPRNRHHITVAYCLLDDYRESRALKPWSKLCRLCWKSFQTFAYGLLERITLVRVARQ